jgi:hypothetical protein
VGIAAASSAGVDLALNVDAQVGRWPVTGLPMISPVE